LALIPFVELGGVSGALDVVVTPSSISRALATGTLPAEVSAHLGAMAPVPDPIERSLLQASAVLGRGEFVPTAGFLWIEDADVRDLLRTRRRTADLFIDPSPLGGLLIAPGVELDRLVLRCRGLGVEVLSDGEVYHARSRTPAPKRKLTPPPESGVRAGRRRSGVQSASRSSSSSSSASTASGRRR
jgi:hypothetical protein